MAIYHLSCTSIGRSSGKSAVAAAAYRSTCKMVERKTGTTHDYTRKEKAIWTCLLHKKSAPAWANDREEFWNRVEEKENRSNSEFCKSFDLALPKELATPEGVTTNMKKLVYDWAVENYVKHGLLADIVIHAPHKNRNGTTNNNWHAHVLISTRAFDSTTKDGWSRTKCALINGPDREKHLEQARKSWADLVNAEFARLGMTERIDHRTLEAQGIDRVPQQHMGKTATAMERKGKRPDRTRQGRPKTAKTIEEVNSAIKQLETESKAIEQELAKIKNAKKNERKPNTFECLTREEHEGLARGDIETAETVYLKYNRFGGRTTIGKLLQADKTQKGAEVLQVCRNLQNAEKQTGKRANWLKAVKYINGWAQQLQVVARALRDGAERIIREHNRPLKAPQTHENGPQQARKSISDTEQGYS